jgi:L-lactate dehydrogenase (cytochrome)
MTPHATRGKFEIFIDGGVRRATDVLKAIALGATAVGIGRPMIYAMSTYGEEGVRKLVQILRVSLAVVRVKKAMLTSRTNLR